MAGIFKTNMPNPNFNPDRDEVAVKLRSLKVPDEIIQDLLSGISNFEKESFDSLVAKIQLGNHRIDIVVPASQSGTVPSTPDYLILRFYHDEYKGIVKDVVVNQYAFIDLQRKVANHSDEAGYRVRACDYSQNPELFAYFLNDLLSQIKNHQNLSAQRLGEFLAYIQNQVLSDLSEDQLAKGQRSLTLIREQTEKYEQKIAKITTESIPKHLVKDLRKRVSVQLSDQYYHVHQGYFILANVEQNPNVTLGTVGLGPCIGLAMVCRCASEIRWIGLGHLDPSQDFLGTLSDVFHELGNRNLDMDSLDFEFHVIGGFKSLRQHATLHEGLSSLFPKARLNYLSLTTEHGKTANLAVSATGEVLDLLYVNHPTARIKEIDMMALMVGAINKQRARLEVI
ncbi:MAG: hypothetical protein NZO16_07945 [Deltaproteobacteria bacterium]|nr:hypothetical protein [Deltaproteobacteria bacterium]